MTLTPYGKREWGLALLAGGSLALAAALLHLAGVAAVLLLLAIAAAAFFRDPDRRLPDGPGLFTAPADGLLDDITTLEGEDARSALPGCDRVYRIGIFLSVFDVHINRAPCDFAVTRDVHRPGGYLDARDTAATRLNEAHTLFGATAQACGSLPIAVRQVAGRIARRIVCAAKPGDTLARGQRYGMIKFGSRTELYLPAIPEIELVAPLHSRATGGVTILARYRPSV